MEKNRVYETLNKTTTFQNDITRILAMKNIIIMLTDHGTILKIYNFDQIARFDNESIFQQIKYIYKDNKDYLLTLFPSKDIFESFSNITPNLCINLVNQNTSTKHPKLILLDLFNSFKGGDKAYYYYSTT